jgi:predicted nuclease of predicted toxin-antitoxin system
MRFLVDECTGPAVAQWLKGEGYNIYSVFDESPGILDEEVLRRAVNEQRVLITNDKDFGERVYRLHQPHHGVVLLRLDDERSQNKIAVLNDLLKKYKKELVDQFVVVTEKQVRFGAQLE